jgi:hypothetical protein
LNNPLSYTDPSGYSAWTKFRDKVLKPVAAIVISVDLPGSTAIWGAAGEGFGATVATGALAGYVATGSLKGALTAAFTAGMAQFAAPGIDGIDSTTSGMSAQRVIVAAVVGGTTSVITGGKFGNGSITGVFSRAFYDELHFNGKKLKWVDDDGNTVEEWDAVSGREGSTVDDQNVEDVGPMPEGEYYIEQNGLQKYDDLQIQDKGLGILGRGHWPGGKTAWGTVRVWATPEPLTQTFGRSGFSIHGGSYSGSAGCVDLTVHMSSFTNRFQSYNQDIVMKVQY